MKDEKLSNMAESTRKERYMVKEVNAKVESKWGKERYVGKEVNAKVESKWGKERYVGKEVEVEPKMGNGQYLAIEGEAKDNYVIVDRNVESEFTNEEEFDVLTVTHNEVTTVVQGLDKKNWILRITRELSEKTFFKGSEQIDKISQRKEKLERNKLNPIVQAAIANQLLRQSKDENNKFCDSTDDEQNESSYEETPNTSVEPVEKNKFCDSMDDDQNESSYEETPNTSVEPVEKVKKTANTEIKNPSNKLLQKENAIQNFKSDKLSYEVETANATSVELVEKVKKTANTEIKNPSNELGQKENDIQNFQSDTLSYEVETANATSVELVEKVKKTANTEIKNPSNEFGQKEIAIQNFKRSDKLSYEVETANANSVELVKIKNASKEEARIREIFHMDVAEVIIERDQQRL